VAPVVEALGFTRPADLEASQPGAPGACSKQTPPVAAESRESTRHFFATEFPEIGKQVGRGTCSRDSKKLPLESRGLGWPCSACRIRHLDPIWQPRTGSLFQ
jgi:hypothetical protein